ncbi:hypothetical protein LEP1GSC170_3898 [Leptospira interrogans serovar Bataviae str. HAI135]|nr:hypothetical protein LEP1GSC170_3898 [Leptospira interrogans serovar Bataviae str. HAI135]
MYNPRDELIEILYAEDNPQDSELTLRSLKNIILQIKLNTYETEKRLWNIYTQPDVTQIGIKHEYLPLFFWI